MTWPRIYVEIAVTEECVRDADAATLLAIRDAEADRVRKQLVDVYGRIV